MDMKDSMQQPLMALIATHTSDLTNNIAARRYKAKGYQQRVLAIPDTSESVEATIERMDCLLEDTEHGALIVAVVEANYGTPASHLCNRSLLNHIVERYNPFYLVLQSTTSESLDDAQLWLSERSFESPDLKPKLICVDTKSFDCFKHERETIPSVGQFCLDSEDTQGKRRRLTVS